MTYFLEENMEAIKKVINSIWFCSLMIVLIIIRCVDSGGSSGGDCSSGSSAVSS